MEDSRSKENRTLHVWMRWHAQHPWAMRRNVWFMTTRTWQTNKRTAQSRVSVHMRCVESVLGLGDHVVIGVVLGFHHTYAIPSAEFFPSGYCSRIVHLWSDCILWSSISSVAKLLHTFPSRTWVIWGVVFSTPVGYSRQPSAVNDPTVTKQIEFVKVILEGSRQNTIGNGSHRSRNTWCISFLTFGMIRSPPWTLPIPPCGRWTACLPLLVFVRIRRHLWFFFCFLLQSLQSRQCLLEIRSMPEWSHHLLLLWKYSSAVKWWVWSSSAGASHRRQKIFVSMILNHSNTEFLISYETVMDSMEISPFAFLLQLISRKYSLSPGLLPYRCPWGLPFLMAYSGTERRSIV